MPTPPVTTTSGSLPAVEHTASRISPTPESSTVTKQAPALPVRPTSVGPDLSVAQSVPAQPTEQAPHGPAVRMVNSKRINLNYEIKDVGPSGISGVELWFTQDSRTWKKYEGTTQRQPPYTAEVNEEGLYGFTLVARSGVGLGKEPPQAGDLPQVWVEVDLSKPVVTVTSTETGITNKSPSLTVRWTVQDKNLSLRPVTLSYAELPDGPWTPIAANLENTGQHVWPLPATAPRRFYVRVEATDLVGNVGTAQTPTPVTIDLSQPSISILTVEPSAR
jgi:hypothetical protein